MALYLAGRGHDVAVHYASSRDAAEETAAEARALGVQGRGHAAGRPAGRAATQALVPAAARRWAGR
jgi:hypothetical protein